MIINTTSDGSTEPQINTACPPNEDRPEIVAPRAATHSTKRYRLVCEGTSIRMKACRLSGRELLFAKHVIERREYDLYAIAYELKERGLHLDINNPDHCVEYDVALADEVCFVLYDPKGQEVFLGGKLNGVVDPECSKDVAPQRDNSTVVNIERSIGEIQAYILETADVPLVEDFSTILYETRIGDETLSFVKAVMYKGETLELEDRNTDSLVQDEDFDKSWATVI
jgi:hypothetical protein